MNIAINWAFVGGIMLICLSPVIWFSPAILRRLRAVIPRKNSKRSADAPAPPGAVEWVTDIVEAMGAADAETILKALRDGATRDQARMIRIEELESGGKS